MSAKFQVEKRDGKFTEVSRAIHREQTNALPDGKWEIQIAEATRYTPTRYKYYFSSVLVAILTQAGGHFRMTSPMTGEERMPYNTTELHEIMKAIHNPVILVCNGKTRVIAGTTTDMNDREFINDFLDGAVMSEYAGPPFNVQFEMYPEWRERMKAKREIAV